MKKNVTKSMAVLLSALLLFSALTGGGFAADAGYGPYEYDAYVQATDAARQPVRSASMSLVQKAFYNILNGVANSLLKAICALYPNPADWKDISEYDGANFLPGRETYATEAAESNFWSLGYASRTIIPDDFAPGKYYIGRDLTNRLAQGVNDDNRVRVVAVDDNSGEGLVVFAVVDALGVTSADTLAVREAALAWAAEKGIRIAAINLSASHSHSAIDAQGVATESIYKILTTGVKTMLGVDADKKLQNAESFKRYYVNAVIGAVEDAVQDMRAGKLYYARIDCGHYTVDKRGLIAEKDMPDIASLKFVPDDGSDGVYIADIACHPTTFGAGAGLFSGDYIYYLEQRIAEKTGYRFLFMQGASGQISKKNTSLDESQIPADERLGASTRYLGKVFGDLILQADDGAMEELPPVLNAKYTSFTFTPENYILVLAVKSQLVNNQVYTNGRGVDNITIVMEEGYVEFGGRVGLGVFPVELYPEVFYGTDIINGGNYAAVAWEGTDWDYAAPAELAPRDGIDMYALHLCNDSLGYCVPDNNFAFLGHIIGDEIADETLSLGKHTASKVVTEFRTLMNSIG